MGLIARAIEAAGVPTLCMTSARSITRAVNPPRAAFLDFPLGHTTGKPHDPVGQRRILLGAFEAFRTIDAPGGVVDLDETWAADDAWKDAVMRPRDPDAPGGADADFEDDRAPRHATPQYQCEADQRAAEAALASTGCPTCVFLE